MPLDLFETHMDSEKEKTSKVQGEGGQNFDQGDFRVASEVRTSFYVSFSQKKVDHYVF